MSNDFIPFAVGGSANVITQPAYAALTSITQNGFQSGIAQSNQLNKVWRQSSIMSAVLAQFIVDQSGQNAVDDGTTATLETNLIAAIRNAAKQTVILTDTGVANAYTATNTPALTALPGTGYTQRVNIAHANTGASTYAPDGLTAKPIYGLGLQPLQGGELPVGIAILMYLVQAGVNSGNGAWIIIESLGGASQIAPATQSQHAMQLGQATGRLLAVRVFTVSGTYTPTAGTNSIDVELVGGGGGGGGTVATGAAAVSIGGGGGAGAYSRGRFLSGFSGATMTIGAAGTGGASGGGTGGTGGATSFGALMGANGGFGGQGGSNSAPVYVQAGGAGGGAGTGNILAQSGQAGQPSTAAALGSFLSGGGAATKFGGGGAPIGTNTLPGNSASSYGAGGGGASNGASTSGQTGGAGGPGVIIVTEYF